MAVKVSEEVFEGLEAARDIGRFNMFAFLHVHDFVKSMGFKETAKWMVENSSLYIEGVWEGFTT